LCLCAVLLSTGCQSVKNYSIRSYQGPAVQNDFGMTHPEYVMPAARN